MYCETYDFMAFSKEDALERMMKIIDEHYQKYEKKLHIQDLWMIGENLWRCNLSY